MPICLYKQGFIVVLPLRDLEKRKKQEEGSISGNPTVLWRGNGYHIYQPVDGFILEEYETFYEFTKYLIKIDQSFYSICRGTLYILCSRSSAPSHCKVMFG